MGLEFPSFPRLGLCIRAEQVAEVVSLLAAVAVVVAVLTSVYLMPTLAPDDGARTGWLCWIPTRTAFVLESVLVSVSVAACIQCCLLDSDHRVRPR